MVLDKETLYPVSILIHPGGPNDAKIFENILKELKRRRLLKKHTQLLFDRGYYSKENYKISINVYRTLSIIFPRSSNIIEKINKEISYPLEIYSSPNVEKEKAEIKKLKRLLLKKLENWKELTPNKSK